MSNRCCYLPPQRWPDSDRSLLEKVRSRGVGLLDEPFVGSRWRARTWRTNIEAYGYFLGWLKQQGNIEDVPPLQRCTEDRIRDYIAYMAQRVSQGSIHNRIVGLERMLAVFAPGQTCEPLKRAISNIGRPGRRHIDEARFRAPATCLELGFSLMRAAQSSGNKNQRRNAVLYRDGLLLCLLTTRMLRREAWAKMRLGHHLVREGGLWWIVFREGETNKRYQDAPVPESLVAPLETYLKVYRPILAGRQSEDGPVWLTYRGRPVTGPDLLTAISNRTRSAFGAAISPHMFRSIGPTAIVAANPCGASDAADALAHSKLATMERHYLRNQAEMSALKHHALIARLRGRA